MTELSIKLPAGYEEDRVPARLCRIDESDQHARDWFRDFRIVPQHASTLNVEPGQYVVEAFWRNGRMTSHRLAVERSPTEFVLVPPSSRRKAKTSDRDFSQPSAGGMFWGSRRSGNGTAPTVFRSCQETWTFLCDRHALQQASNVTPEHLPVRRLIDVTVRGNDDGSRSWMLYWASGSWAVSSLPLSNTDHDAVTLRADPKDLPYVAASDPDFGMMTDLLPSGNAEAAHRYASVVYDACQSQDLERWIVCRPLEICAFAYAEHETLAESQWMKLLEKILTRHADISDVAVLLGWRMLMAARSENDWRVAGTFFERAVEIGVPFYSLGVRLLAEGLTMIAPTFDDHANSAALVRAVAARIVPTEAFTTVRF